MRVRLRGTRSDLPGRVGCPVNRLIANAAGRGRDRPRNVLKNYRGVMPPRAITPPTVIVAWPVRIVNPWPGQPETVDSVVRARALRNNRARS